MLALSRKKNEALVIDNKIEVTILEIQGDQVKVGISAPKEVPIYRKEVYLQIQEANKQALAPEGLEALKKLSKKGNSYNNIFKKKINNYSTGDENNISRLNEFSYYNQSSKYFEFNNKNSIDDKFRLYKYYQKNKNTNLQNKFFINQNYDKLNYIINNNSKNIKHLLPRNPFDKKEKHYYSAFLKY